MDYFVIDSRIQLRWQPPNLGHTFKWSWRPPGEKLVSAALIFCSCRARKLGLLYKSQITWSINSKHTSLGLLPLLQETLLRICCAMLILVRRRLLAGDFTSNLKLLQKYPSTNISHLLYVANKLRGSSSGWIFMPHLCFLSLQVWVVKNFLLVNAHWSKVSVCVFLSLAVLHILSE